MMCNPILTLLLIRMAMTAPSFINNNSLECNHSVFVESPVADTYIVTDQDTATFGHESVLKVRGLPERKSIQTLLSYEVHHLDPNYLKIAYLRVYTATKDRGDHLLVLGCNHHIDEDKTHWKNKPLTQQVLDEQRVTEAAFIQFEVTDYVRSHLKDGFLDFNIQSDSKKVIEIASRESGLSAELILEMCGNSKEHILDNNQECQLRVLPSTLDGKLTLQLLNMPAGGFAQLMLMTDQGDILFQIPLAIQDAQVSYHTVDFRNLVPGVFWAVLRKGRVMVKDQFRVKPENGTTLLKVDGDYLAQREK